MLPLAATVVALGAGVVLVAVVDPLSVEVGAGPVAGCVVAVAFVSGLCVVVSTLQYWTRFGYLLISPAGKTRTPA